MSAFLQASAELNNEHISKQKGYISWKQLYDEQKGVWADFLTFKTMEDVKNFENNSATAGDLAEQFYFFINMNSCRIHYFNVERSY
ncbi:MAG: hypothetical protein LBC96_01115 [Lachnospiraceae bacterium]|nr:hypothetical protein [Lachnospiraceae bacterium]